MKEHTENERMKRKGWKKIFYANENQKKALVAICRSEKAGFKRKTVIRDKEEHCIVIKRSIQEEDITFVTIYAPNIGAPKYVKQILMDIKGDKTLI